MSAELKFLSKFLGVIGAKIFIVVMLLVACVYLVGAILAVNLLINPP